MAKSQVFTGVIWASTQRFGTMVVTFLANLVLARLLTPAEFGLVGMLMFFMAVANVLVDSGFGSAIIQRKEATDRDFSTAFIINMCISTGLYVILYLVAPLIAWFFNVELLSMLIRVEGLALIFNALSVVQSAILRRQMDFRHVATANLVGNTLGTILAIGAAMAGMGVWSLVIRIVFVAAITSGMLWRVGSWRPRMEFDRQSARELFGFGGFILLSSLLNTISNNSQLLLIGKIFHQRQLGLYSQATTLRNSAADGISSVIAQVLYPDYSRLKDDQKIIEKLNRGFYIIAYVAAAVMIFLLVMATPLIDWLYGAEWLPSAPLFQMLCVGGIFYAIQDVNYFVVAAKGKSKILFICNVIKIPLYVVALLVVGKLWGLYPMVWVVVINNVVSYIIFSMMANQLLHYSIRHQLWCIVKALVICLIPAGLLLATDYALSSTANITRIALGVIVYFGVLWGVSAACRSMPYEYIVEKLTNIQNHGKA